MKKAFINVLHNICQTKMNSISFERYSRIHMDGPKIAACETACDSVFVINTSFASKDAYFLHALAEACDAFNAAMLEFSYTQNLEPCNPTQHQVQPPQKL